MKPILTSPQRVRVICNDATFRARKICRRTLGRSGLLTLAMAALMWMTQPAPAFPPAPHHLIYGTVRDEYGTPLMTSQAQLLLVTPTGATIPSSVVPGLGYNINYELEVPMDAALTPDPYEPNALIAGASFQIYVVIGQTTNLPIQMAGNFSRIGQPGQQTRVDLTLGVDANGDGIPDAWETAYLAALGSNLGLGNLNANSIIGPNGFTLLQEFLAGYYPYDPADTFTLQLLNISGSSALLQFTAMTGRYYSLLGSGDLRSWVPLSFRLPIEGSAGALHTYFYSTGIQTVQVQTVAPGVGAPPALNFNRAGGQISLSWSTNAPGFSVVSATSLDSPTWHTVPAMPSVVGDHYVLTSTPAGAGQFYRLSAVPVHYFKLVLQ